MTVKKYVIDDKKDTYEAYDKSEVDVLLAGIHPEVEIATKATPGIVQVGDGLDVTDGGVLSSKSTVGIIFTLASSKWSSTLTENGYEYSEAVVISESNQELIAGFKTCYVDDGTETHDEYCALAEAMVELYQVTDDYKFKFSCHGTIPSIDVKVKVRFSWF